MLILNISAILNPEAEVVKTIQRAITTPGADDVSEFAEGRIKLISIRVNDDSPLKGISFVASAPSVSGGRRPAVKHTEP